VCNSVYNKRGSIMKLFTMTIAAFLFVGITGLALGNPSMLPKHPGYPSRGEFANDRGQQNLTYSQSLSEAAKSGDTNMAPTLMDPNNARLLEHGGAGQLPVVQGPKIKIEPPVTEGTRMPAK
jgi:hypothetical protein